MSLKHLNCSLNRIDTCTWYNTKPVEICMLYKHTHSNNDVRVSNVSNNIAIYSWITYIE